MRAAGMVAREVIEVPYWAVWGVIGCSQEASGRGGRFFDVAVPNRTAKFAGSLTKDNGVAGAIVQVAHSNERVPEEGAVAAVGCVLNFKSSKNACVVGTGYSKQLVPFIDIVRVFFIVVVVVVVMLFAFVLADFEDGGHGVRWADERRNDRFQKGCVHRGCDRVYRVQLVKQVGLFHVRQDRLSVAPTWFGGLSPVDPATWKALRC